MSIKHGAKVERKIRSLKEKEIGGEFVYDDW